MSADVLDAIILGLIERIDRQTNIPGRYMDPDDDYMTNRRERLLDFRNMLAELRSAE